MTMQIPFDFFLQSFFLKIYCDIFQESNMFLCAKCVVYFSSINPLFIYLKINISNSCNIYPLVGKQIHIHAQTVLRSELVTVTVPTTHVL